LIGRCIVFLIGRNFTVCGSSEIEELVGYVLKDELEITLGVGSRAVLINSYE
jgi:hypothetical protein